MGNFLENQIGSTTAVYTAAQYVAGLTPRLGDFFYDAGTCKTYVFLRNSASTAIAASIAVTSAATERAYAPIAATTTAFQSATPSCKVPAATADLVFAGVRDVGATSMAQHECGWFGCKGPLSLTADATGTTAEKVQVTSSSIAGNVRTISSTYAVAMGPGTMIGIARATATAAVTIVDCPCSIWGC